MKIMKGVKKRKTTISIGKRRWKEFRKLAVERDISTSGLLEGIVRRYVKRRKRLRAVRS